MWRQIVELPFHVFFSNRIWHCCSRLIQIWIKFAVWDETWKTVVVSTVVTVSVIITSKRAVNEYKVAKGVWYYFAVCPTQLITYLTELAIGGYNYSAKYE